MGDERSHIEFLEPHEDPGDIAWLDADGEGEGADEEDVGGSREGSLLPPLTTARRVLLSLLVFALALATTGFAGVDAFRHDQAVQAAENELVLREVVNAANPVKLTDPAEVGGPGAWRLDPSASIAVGVTNEGPDPITLLPGATLYGLGLTTPAALRPTGPTLLRPGQSGELTGVVTANCGVQADNASALNQSDTVLVQARTTSGAMGAASVDLNTGGQSARMEICSKEGQALAANFLPQSVDPAAHTFTIGLAAHSLAVQPVRYQLTASYSSFPVSILVVDEGLLPVEAGTLKSDNDPALAVPGSTATINLPGVKLSAPAPIGTVNGTLAAGARLSAGFTVHVLSCPSAVPKTRTGLELSVAVEGNGTPALFQANGFDLDTLVGMACGLIL